MLWRVNLNATAEKRRSGRDKEAIRRYKIDEIDLHNRRSDQRG